MKSLQSAYDFYILAEKARESDEHKKSLEFLDKALTGYTLEKNYKGIVSALLSKSLANKHLYLLGKKNVYRIQAKENCEDAIYIAKKYHLSQEIYLSYFYLAQVEMLFDSFSEAIKDYNLALTNYKGTHIEHGYFTYHLGEAFFRNGQKKEGQEKILEGLAEIEEHMDQVGRFESYVWLTGGYLRLAELVNSTNHTLAKSYLLKAADAIAKYEKNKKPEEQDLIIRKRQLKILDETLE